MHGSPHSTKIKQTKNACRRGMQRSSIKAWRGLPHHCRRLQLLLVAHVPHAVAVGGYPDRRASCLQRPWCVGQTKPCSVDDAQAGYVTARYLTTVLNGKLPTR